MADKWYFACDSDQHFCIPEGAPPGSEPRPRKDAIIVEKIKALRRQYGLDLLLCPGDCTDHCSDGSGWLTCVGKGDQYGDEFGHFVTDFIDPLEREGLPVYACPGNHDVDNWRYPGVSILKYIRAKHGGTYKWSDRDVSGYYKFEHKGVCFMCLGIFPKDLAWLKENLPKDKTRPIVIYYHYNTNPAEAFADWWTEEHKQKFYDTISGHNVKLIVNGHLHKTQQGEWKGIPYVLCARQTVVVEVAQERITLIM